MKCFNRYSVSGVSAFQSRLKPLLLGLLGKQRYNRVMDWLMFITNIINRVPIERVLFPPPDNTKALEDFVTSMGSTQVANIALPEQKATSTITPEVESPPTVHLAIPSETGPTTEEIVAYHNKKVGKHLGALEGHYADRMRIFGKPCDCGSSKHLLMLEQFSEETIPMVDNPSIYEEIIQWVREVEPKSTDAAAKSGKYDDEYPILSGQARAFRKRVLGTTALSAMIERKEPSSSGNCPNCGGPLDKDGCCPKCGICPLPQPTKELDTPPLTNFPSCVTVLL